jgi:hypothetical protein
MTSQIFFKIYAIKIKIKFNISNFILKNVNTKIIKLQKLFIIYSTQKRFVFNLAKKNLQNFNFVYKLKILNKFVNVNIYIISQ